MIDIKTLYRLTLGSLLCSLTGNHTVSEDKEDEVMKYGIVEADCERCGYPVRLERIDDKHYYIIIDYWDVDDI